MREHLHCAWNDSQHDEKSSVSHFHKLDDHTESELGAETHTHLSTQCGKKRKFCTEQEEHKNTYSAAKRSASLCHLSADDLDLLNSY